MKNLLGIRTLKKMFKDHLDKEVVYILNKKYSASELLEKADEKTYREEYKLYLARLIGEGKIYRKGQSFYKS